MNNYNSFGYVILGLILIKLAMSDIINVEYIESNGFTILVSYDYYKNYRFMKGLDQIEQYSIFFSTDTNKKDEIIETNYKIKISNIESTVDIVKDKITLINNKSLSFLYYNIKDRNNYKLANEAFALGYKINNENFSFIHQLKTQKVIDNLSYSFVPINIDGGRVYFGGLPKNETKGKYESLCKIRKEFSFWACDFNYAFYKKDNREIVYYNRNSKKKQIAIFQSGIKEIKLPSSFYRFIIYNYFIHFILSNQCKNYKPKDIIVIECKKDIITKLKDINIILDGNIFILEIKQLFDKAFFQPLSRENEYLQCLLIENKNNDDSLILGGSFLSLIISHFDYNDDYIHLYTNYHIEHLSSLTSNFNSCGVLLSISIILLTIGIFIIIIINLYK